MLNYYTTMVKNFGGNKSKRGARKYLTTSQTRNTRKAELEGETYAMIKNIYGNGRAEILCIDGISRILIIRKKVKGRNKRENNVSKGVWVLAGKRQWEVRDINTKEVCDLLEVYDTNDIDFLKNSVDMDWSIFSIQKDEDTDDIGEEVTFVDEETQQYEDIINAEDNTHVTAKLDWLENDSDLDLDDL